MIEPFLDLMIATIADGEAPPEDADLVRILEPSRRAVRARTGEGWFHKPCYVTYFVAVPRSLDEHLERTFRPGSRANVRKLLRDVPRRYALEIDGDGRGLDAFRALYRRTVVDRPRGVDRMEGDERAFGGEWLGYFLRNGDAMVAGVLVKIMRRHLSVAYGAFDPAHRRGCDLEHFLLLQVLSRSIAERHVSMTLGVDTNRYGHHLSLGIAPYKLRIGFTPAPYEAGGDELLRIERFDRFEHGLFFYAYGEGGLVGHLFSRGTPNLRPFKHRTAPPIVTHPIP